MPHLCSEALCLGCRCCCICLGQGACIGLLALCQGGCELLQLGLKLFLLLREAAHVLPQAQPALLLVQLLQSIGGLHACTWQQRCWRQG